VPFDRQSYRQLEPLIRAARRAAVVTHINPDGDGVGSGLALARFLRNRGLDARFIPNRAVPASLAFLAPNGEAAPFVPALGPFLRDADLVITVDNASVERLGPLEADIRASRATRVCIDHHLMREPFWTLNIVDEEACSTGEMVHDCIRELGGTLDRAMAEAIYVAILTDTGSFRFSRTTGRVHRVVADLLDLGVEPHEIWHQVHERNPPGSLRLLGAALLDARFAAGGRLAWVELPLALLEECGAAEEDSSEIINHLLTVEGVEIALLFREQRDGATKMSLRSRPRHDVNALARAHGGGGHRNAAGAVAARPMAECVARLVPEATAVLG
jgi:bifunctional oligoribonuclease and PAP phosphatase NrnA